MTDVDPRSIREAFEAELTDWLPASDIVQRAQRGGRRRQLRSRLAVVGSGAAAAGVVAVVLLASQGTTAPVAPAKQGASMQLAGMIVHLSPGYRVSADGSQTCQEFLRSNKHTTIVIQRPESVADMKAAHPTVFALSDVLITAPSQALGCIRSNLSDPYDAPAGVTADSPLFQPTTHATSTTIDGSHAETAAIKVLVPLGADQTGTVLYARVPATNGQFRLLTVIGWSVPPEELVDLARQALKP